MLFWLLSSLLIISYCTAAYLVSFLCSTKVESPERHFLDIDSGMWNDTHDL